MTLPTVEGTKTVNNNRVDRIATLIQEYNIIELIHIQDRQNCLPDYLSRYPRGSEDELFEIDYGLVSKNSSEPVTSSVPRPQVNMILRPRNKQTSPDPKVVISNDITTPDDNSSTIISSRSPQKHAPRTISSNYFDSARLKDEQRNDPRIQEIVHRLRLPSPNLPFVLCDGVLCKLIAPSPRSKIKHPVPYVPSSMVKALLNASHNDPLSGGHFSFERIYKKIEK